MSACRHENGDTVWSNLQILIYIALAVVNCKMPLSVNVLIKKKCYCCFIVYFFREPYTVARHPMHDDSRFVEACKKLVEAVHGGAQVHVQGFVHDTNGVPYALVFHACEVSLYICKPSIKYKFKV